MIRMKGQDAVNQVYYVMNNMDLFLDFSTFLIEKDTHRIPVSPDQVLRMLKNREARINEVVCEIISMWDVLRLAEKEGSLTVHPAQNVVLIFNQVYGDELQKGVRALVVHNSVFESVVGWAMQTPLIERDADFEKFFQYLTPRMTLKNGAWEQNRELLRFSFEIANELMRVFKIDVNGIWKEIFKRDPSLYAENEPTVHGGILLDEVLHKICGTPLHRSSVIHPKKGTPLSKSPA